MPETFAIREPTADEIRRTFGTLKRCLEATRGDLPTVLHFMANPDKLVGFKSPKGARRVGYGSYAKRLREWLADDKRAEREKLVAELAKLVEQRLAATWSDGRPVHNRAKPLRLQSLLGEVGRMPGRPAWLHITRRAIAEAVEAINKRLAPEWRWIIPAPRTRADTPAARDRAMRSAAPRRR